MLLSVVFNLAHVAALWGLTFFAEIDNPLVFTFIGSLGFGVVACNLRRHRFLLWSYGAVTLLFWGFIAYLLINSPIMD